MALLLALLALASASGAATPRHVSQLYNFLDAKTAPEVGVLSQGNFDSVHHLFPDKAVPRIFDHVDELVACTRNGSVDASLISGLPEDATGLVTFSSALVSVRAMFSAEPADTLRLALDAAIVRALHGNADTTAAARNQPFRFVAVHTCRTDQVERFPFPTPVAGDRLAEAVARGHLRIAALGPYNWKQDGDYTPEDGKYTGFWPEFLAAVESHFKAEYNVGFERVWALSSKGTMDLLLSGDADATEPYWTIDAYHNVTGSGAHGGPWEYLARPHAFIYSCTTLGYDSTFLVADTELQGEKAREAELVLEVEGLKSEVDKLRTATTTAVDESAAVALAVGALVAFL
jgi:hypothetical protein